MAFQQFFPCIPEYMSWEDWMGNVFVYYGQKNIEVTPEEDWQVAAMNLVNSESFGVYPVPSPYNFDNWQDWAKQFTEIINGPSH
jgi:hypothetical protein